MSNKLLLHTCCAPCLTGTIFQKEDFRITIFWYNPNIYPIEEYLIRKREVERYAQVIQCEFVDGDRDGNDFSLWDNSVVGLESEVEGGRRCGACFKVRLKKAAEFAKENSFDFFATTLTTSPFKDSNVINLLGKEMADKVGTTYLSSDFKKNDGYKLSQQVCKEFRIYRQRYCGCRFSLR